MALKVKILPENLANKIAAGEVVERPASIVKELVENALDAGASEIRLETVAGGRRLVRVTDNGHGMSRDDAILALERHATSKIRNDDDLDGIATLGFRGEALPAIAAVSRLRLKTREASGIEGTEIYVEGGRIKDAKSCGMASGTDITVEQIFFNTPARLKFLKSAETEAAHLGEQMVRLAISRPDVAFSYINDGKEQFRTSSGTLLQRLQKLLPRDTVLFPVSLEAGPIRLSGYMAPPDAARSGYSSMFTFINGRFVRDKVVQHAIMQAWRPVLEKGRYPVLAVFIDLPPSDVDVNVHPTKHEVRFRNQKQVHDTIHLALSEALSRSPWLRPAPLTSSPAPEPDSSYINPPQYATDGNRVRQAVENYMKANRSDLFTTPLPRVHESDARYEQPEFPTAKEGGYFSGLSVIGQFRAAYILCEGEDGLVLIDQHAAYERVRFEQLRKSFGSGKVESQGLLVPEVIDLAFEEANTLRTHIRRLEDLGFELEEFGGQTFRLNAVPLVSVSSGHTALLRDLLSELAATGTALSCETLFENLLATIACHSVTRGARRLDPRQIEQLLADMDRTGFSAHCPHGRPVSHTITLPELEKFFRRT